MTFEAANHVVCSTDEKILFYHIGSNIDEEEAIRLYELGKECLSAGGVNYVLIDLKSSTEFSSAARKVWVEFLKDAKIKKSAIYGGNIFVRTLASFVIAATGKHNIKFFLTEKEAREWLFESV